MGCSSIVRADVLDHRGDIVALVAEDIAAAVRCDGLYDQIHLQRRARLCHCRAILPCIINVPNIIDRSRGDFIFGVLNESCCIVALNSFQNIFPVYSIEVHHHLREVSICRISPCPVDICLLISCVLQICDACWWCVVWNCWRFKRDLPRPLIVLWIAVHRDACIYRDVVIVWSKSCCVPCNIAIMIAFYVLLVVCKFLVPAGCITDLYRYIHSLRTSGSVVNDSILDEVCIADC